MTASVPLLAAAVAVLLLSIGYSKLRYLRFRQYAHFAQHPSSLVLGHLKVFGEFVKRNKPKAHADLAMMAMHRALGRPPLMFVDVRPIADPMVVVANYDIAEQITKSTDIFPTSPPKSTLSMTRLRYLTGPTSILAKHGDEWKLLRKRFNQGFSSQYLTTFVPEILDKSLLFLDRLDARCRSGESFSLMDLTMRLTFDIIGKVVMEADLDAQSESNPGELVALSESLAEAYNGDTLNLPWWLTPGKVRRRSARAAKITNLLRGIVHQKYTQLQSSDNPQTTERSVLSLSLQDIDTLTPRLVDETCDQLQTFLFAGHDTTSILLCWALYELSRTPHALDSIRTELDDFLGPDASPSNIRARLHVKSNQDALAQLPYLNAVIKETLRVHPPAGSARFISPGSGFSVQLPGTEKEPGERVVLDGLLVYLCQSIIHTDPKVFGEDAADFLPERWLLKGKGKGKLISGPVGAWRPFERGPRNCIGQELANIEARIILALVVRRYDFTKIGIGALSKDSKTGLPILNEKLQYKVEEEIFVTRMVTSKPIDGMVMKVKLAE